MTIFELDYRRFKRNPQSKKISLTFTTKIEEMFETLETENIDMTPSNLII